MIHAAMGLNYQMFPVFLGLLLATAISWLYLSDKLYKLLKQNFPELYNALGSPRPFKAINGTASMRVVRFLFRRDYEITRDPALIRLCQGLRYIFIIYALCLGGCLLLLLDKTLQG